MLKVGLLRHFKVKRGYPDKFVTSDQIKKWMVEYDNSDVEEKEIDLKEIEWKRCYSSDLLRAKKTAQKAFKGNIIYLEQLREIPVSPFIKKNIKLPLYVHFILTRLAFYFNHHSQDESRHSMMKRLNEALDQVLSTNEDVLIVGHGGLMFFMQKELKKRGFTGPGFKRAENGELYVYHKN
ncbi:hypothetical protein HNQ94_001723 [Salirhabdus euzebyi]|uniref:Phosphoglycerate mutase n=1 Tax=Salirhabdus euzebyi TaxID=394506 RepID=A0A841Q4F5_9BACI|nr:histidine phosphatase family protein [Salirhabdus euzebyi]MBB6453275.1 hypothetical protein [Salirhabdus euzebyi]